MCGIAGIWKQVDERAVQDMMTTQAHRGPDGRGTFVRPGNGVLGHVRLSIMDPQGGQQPLYSENNESVIVANGEIYNHDLLKQLLRSQHNFVTTSDSETILHLFEEQGFATPRRLDGMFAFAIAENDDLFLARDPIGIKPLYYGLENEGQPDETFYFASELKAISKWVADVHEFAPGSYYHSQTGFHKYYAVPHNQPRQLPIVDHIRNVRQTLEQAIIKRLMSDVPLGAFLSGGLDSSIIAALVRQQVAELHTFSVGIEGSADILAARQVAQHIDSVHHEYLYTAQEVIDKLPEIIYHLESFDQDLVRSAIPCYFCSRMAAQEAKVILTGEGADELFAGYTYYKDIDDDAALHQELHRSVTGLHNINLQRVDRLTMAHGLEGRVPFLDVSMIELAQTIPPELKLKRTSGGQRIEKWVLRKAVEDLLPPEIVWRDKEQFDEGSGTVDLLDQLIKTATTDIDVEAYRAEYPNTQLRSAEECFYHKLLVDNFEKSDVVLKNVARWTERP